MRFSVFLETDNENEWVRLVTYLYESGSPFNNPNYHENVIRLLKNVGLDSVANELEMLRPSEDDIEFGNTPYGGLGMTMNDVLKHKNRQKQTDSFRAASRAYSDAIDNIADIAQEKAEQMGWAKRDQLLKKGFWF